MEDTEWQKQMDEANTCKGGKRKDIIFDTKTATKQMNQFIKN